MNKYIKYLLIFIFILFCYFFTKFYTNNEIALYRCDYVEQNLFYYDFGNYLVNHNFSRFFNEMFFDIKHWNRHPFLVIFLLPFYFIFKNSRFGFIFATEIIFMLPVMILTVLIIKNKIITKNNSLFDFFIYSLVFLCPALWLCSLRGIPDICGMVPVLAAWILYFKDDMSSFKSFKTVIFVSILLYLAFLIRRWYSVVIFSFFVSVFAENIIHFFIMKLKYNEILKKAGISLFNIFFSGIIIYFLAFLIQTEYIKNIILSESTERAIYSTGASLFEQLRIVFSQNIGLLYSFFALAAIILLFKNKEIRFTLLNLFTYLFAFFIIMDSQFLWINHYLFPAICIIILFCQGVYKSLEYIKNIKIKNTIICIFIFLNLINFVKCFCIDKYEKLNFMLPYTNGHYIINANYEKIKNIYNYLENEYKKDNSVKIAIFGLNDNIGYYQLRELSGNSDFAKNNIFSETILDSDYQFKELLADYAIVIDPCDIYADETQSRMLHKTHDLFINKEGIAKNYVLVNKYDLSDGKTIHLYKKEKPFSVEQMREYMQNFYQYYPDWEERFEHFLKENNLN